MKVYKNQTEQSAKQLGFYANFAFCSDKIMSPSGIDITPSRDINGKYTYEISTYDEDTKTIRLEILTQEEFNKYQNETFNNNSCS